MACLRPDGGRAEFTLENRRVDFALCHPRTKPAVFIEVKQPGKSEGADRQLFEYAFHLGIPLAVLTDGREWHFYLPAAQGKYQERRVYKLDLIERPIEESEARLARYLTYGAVASGVAQHAAQDDYAGLRKDREIAASVPRAWRQLLEDQDELLVDLLADQVETLCGFKPDPDVVARFLAGEAGAFAARPAHVSLTARSQGRSGPGPRAARARHVSVPHATDREYRGADRRGGNGERVRLARDRLCGARPGDADAKREGHAGAVLRSDGAARPNVPHAFCRAPAPRPAAALLAADRDALYPGRADLAAEYAHGVVPGWWLGSITAHSRSRRSSAWRARSPGSIRTATCRSACLHDVPIHGRPVIAIEQQMGAGDAALLTAYCVSLTCFEAEVYTVLHRGGTGRVTVLVDQRDYESSFSEILALRGLGIDYRVQASDSQPTRGVHPKLYLTRDAATATLLVASANLTPSRFRRNAEIVDRLVLGTRRENAGAFHAYADLLEALPELDQHLPRDVRVRPLRKTRVRCVRSPGPHLGAPQLARGSFTPHGHR